ncbi:effector-associated constant component EACC1 [Hwangdonia sp.]|uniref:effector-associated constant component EACC1 n=1 Tax=Hwangdonia sp. TaxID=1883432 RepID=UPI003AB8E212
MENKQIEVILNPSSDFFDENDPRWSQQKNLLVRDLQGRATKVEKKSEPMDGMKGGLETLIITLGPAVITGIVDVVKAWLARDKSTKIELSANINGKTVSFTADASGVDKNTLKEFLEQAIEKAS